MQTTKDYDSSFIQLQYYHHDAIEESERTFYFDDGKTVEAFDKGQFQILEFEAEMEGRWLEIDFEAETGTNYKAENKTIELVIHNIKDMPKRIKINNDKANGTYNKKYKTLTLNIIWDTNEEKEIRIKLK
jgi:oligosaccharide 4-alpha-D-glucosyltransferase